VKRNGVFDLISPVVSEHVFRKARRREISQAHSRVILTLRNEGEKSKDHYYDKNILMIIHDTMNLRLLADARSDERWSSVVVEVTRE
jgi:hypothetical protein